MLTINTIIATAPRTDINTPIIKKTAIDPSEIAEQDFLNPLVDFLLTAYRSSLVGVNNCQDKDILSPCKELTDEKEIVL